MERDVACGGFELGRVVVQGVLAARHRRHAAAQVLTSTLSSAMSDFRVPA
jgi:hypothetical protein